MSLKHVGLRFVDIESCVDEIIRRLGTDLRVAMPLGLGKPVELIDALYRRACDDSALSLTIFTALSLERPRESDPIRGRLLNPAKVNYRRIYHSANFTLKRGAA